MNISGKLGWIVALVLALALGMMSYTFLIKGKTVPYADGRTSILLSPDERNGVLGEMRAILAGVQDIIENTVNGDFDAAETRARAMGMAAANAENPQLIAKLPLEFKTLGLGLHGAFDDLGDLISTSDDKLEVIAAVSDIMVQCVACHDAYRLGIEGIEDTGQE